MVGRPCTTVVLFRASDELSSSICKEPQNDKKSQRIEKIFSVVRGCTNPGYTASDLLPTDKNRTPLTDRLIDGSLFDCEG